MRYIKFDNGFTSNEKTNSQSESDRLSILLATARKIATRTIMKNNVKFTILVDLKKKSS